MRREKRRTIADADDRPAARYVAMRSASASNEMWWWPGWQLTRGYKPRPPGTVQLSRGTSLVSFTVAERGPAGSRTPAGGKPDALHADRSSATCCRIRAHSWFVKSPGPTAR